GVLREDGRGRVTIPRSRLMAIDLGDRRIGLAISDPTGTIASPAGFIERRAGKRPPLTALLAKAAALEARGFVVGLPLDANGAETPRTEEARRLALALAMRNGLDARVGGERVTTGAPPPRGRGVRGLGGGACRPPPEGERLPGRRPIPPPPRAWGARPACSRCTRS